MNIRTYRVYLSLVGFAVLWVLTGCAGNAVSSQPANSERAREALTSVLECWKSGQGHDAPGRLSPPIRVADEDWIFGAQLVDFALAESDATNQVGPTIHWPVNLTLRDSKAQSTRRNVLYLVITDPQVSVIRQD